MGGGGYEPRLSEKQNCAQKRNSIKKKKNKTSNPSKGVTRGKTLESKLGKGPKRASLERKGLKNILWNEEKRKAVQM